MRALATEIPKLKKDQPQRFKNLLAHRLVKYLPRFKSEAPIDWNSFMNVLNNNWVKDSTDVACVVDVSFSLIAAENSLTINS